MILKRIAKGIRDQDWFVVTIEVMIVVVGIFIGLQVDDWNEARKDRIDEAEYLERIAEELEISISRNASSVEFQQLHSNLGNTLLTALENCRLEEPERDNFATAIYLLAKTSARAFNKTAIDELMSTGRMTIIQNIKLRQQMVQIIGTYSANAAHMLDVQQRMTPHINYVDSVAPIVISGPIGGGQGVSWDMLRADFQTLCKDKRFYNSFASALNYSWDVTHGLIVWGDQLKYVKKNILSELKLLKGNVQ